jgi:hypothetical protein
MPYFDEIIQKNIGFIAEYSTSDRLVWTREGKIAKSTVISNAIEILVTYYYNGGGPRTFGGAMNWPTVKLKFEFPADSEMLVGDFAEALQKFVIDWVENHKEPE